MGITPFGRAFSMTFSTAFERALMILGGYFLIQFFNFQIVYYEF